VRILTRLIESPWGLASVFYFAFLWRFLLIFAGLSLLIFSGYGLIVSHLGFAPVTERLTRATVILSVTIVASCFAIQRTARCRFGNRMLRIARSGAGPDWCGSTPGLPLTLGRAARVIWSYSWRLVATSLGVNLALARLLLDRFSIQPGNWMLAWQAMLPTVSIVLGVWAMREALEVSYRGFEFRWCALQPAPDSAVS
jgi:hypothetical protein